MLAIDTNVLVRFLTRDQPKQAARAGALLEGHEVFVATTVLLETEWVLRSTYGFEPRQVANALKGFLGLPQVRLRDREMVAQALAWAADGLDFADALHLAAAEDCEAFVSFDERFVKRGRALGASVRHA